jgi:transposase
MRELLQRSWLFNVSGIRCKHLNSVSTEPAAGHGGQSLTSVSRGLGVSAQSIDSWVKADAVGGLKEAKGKPVNADQMEIARLKAELAKMRMERDILKKAAAYFARELR